MEYVRYDEDQLVRLLGRLSMPLRAAFAAACSERLLPAYIRFSKRTGRGEPGELVRMLERLWRDLEGEEMAGTEVEQSITRSMRLVPQEDDGEWVPEHATAEDAAAALTYAFRARQNGEARDAAWAARRAYEALDHFVIDRDGIDTNDPEAESRVLMDAVVQAELMRQQHDLADLLGAKDMTVVAQLRERARADAQVFFG